MSLDRPVLKSRKPTAKVAPPFVVVEGEEGAGKSWAAAILSTSERVSRTFWLDLGEGAADEYGAIEGARYEVLEHDGTYASVLEQVYAVKAEAKRAADAGEPPVVLVIDTMGNVWDGLKDWVSSRAKAKPANQRKLAEDPAAELDVSRNLWNDAGNRYRKLTNALLTFPGIVVGTARGKYISDTDPSTGQPYRDGRKTYRIEGEKGLGHDATLVVRMRLGEPPLITKARSVHAGVRPTDPPVVLDGNREPKGPLLEWLIFDVLKFDPAVSAPRDFKSFTGGELLPDEAADEAAMEARAASTPPATRRPTPPPERDQSRPDPRAQQAATAIDQGARTDLDKIIAEATEGGYLETMVTVGGAEGTLAGYIEHVRPHVIENLAKAAASQEPQAPEEPQNAAQEPRTPVPAAEEPPADVPGPQNGAHGSAMPALELARAVLEESDDNALRALYGMASDAGQLNDDVLAVLGDDDLAAIDKQNVDTMPLGGLIYAAKGYVDRHGTAIRDLGVPDTTTAPAVEDTPEDPWAADAAASVQPGTFTH